MSFIINQCTGTFSVQQEAKTEWTDPVTGQQLNVSHGFKPVIQYHDGTGVDHEGTHWTNEPHCLTASEMVW